MLGSEGIVICVVVWVVANAALAAFLMARPPRHLATRRPLTVVRVNHQAQPPEDDVEQVSAQ